MNISIVDVVQYKYPGQFESGNVSFYVDDSVPHGVAIGDWNVIGEEKPSVQSLVDLFPIYQNQFQNMIVFKECNKLIAQQLDLTAQQKQYSSGVSCASYILSTNPLWATEAKAFIDWRDSVFVYAINIYNEVQQGIIPCPTVNEFMIGLPTIVWPN